MAYVGIFANFNFFEKNWKVFQKQLLFFQRNPKFERFEKSYYSRLVLK